MNLSLLDQQLFLTLNHLPHTALTDSLALALSGIGTAGLVWFILGIILFIKEEKKDHWFFAPFLLSFFGGWLAVEHFIKPWFGRLRPPPEMGAMFIGDGSGGFSFPSGHATIAFALAAVLGAKEKSWKWWLYLLAGLIAFSRVYLGKHYPVDVIAGAIFGWIVGQASLEVSRRARKPLGA